ncbi:hypothetical protein QBC40DRAFT_96807 [Triangularia verruculosa]|uniref:Uncharacterized protein n=1 Tax=Triangularia verruculosa TaxID=2587418 RepID=A0AAN6XCL8_9PEZI|nr:hypothetical protein QBC40DRAFT_96807 [Triangularia verruculosa]
MSPSYCPSQVVSGDLTSRLSRWAGRPLLFWRGCPLTRPFHSAGFHVGVEGERRGTHPTLLPSLLHLTRPQPGLACSTAKSDGLVSGRLQTDDSKSLLLASFSFSFWFSWFCLLSSFYTRGS